MKKRKIIIPVALALLFGICVSSNNSPPEGFDRDSVISASKDFINKVSIKDFDGCYNQFADVMKDSLKIKKLQIAFHTVSDSLGSIKKIRSIHICSVAGSGMSLAKSTVKCECENGTAVYNILFDKNMKIEGIYIK